jgi:hypothetical protein
MYFFFVRWIFFPGLNLSDFNGQGVPKKSNANMNNCHQYPGLITVLDNWTALKFFLLDVAWKFFNPDRDPD